MYENSVCHLCQKVYKTDRTLTKHLRIIHQFYSQKSYECNDCAAKFSTKEKLKLHVHSHITDSSLSSRNNHIKCPQCKIALKSHALLRKHVCDVHGLKISKSVLKFRSESEFFEWKKKIEEETTSFYCRKNSRKQISKGIYRTYYECHRSYSFSSRVDNNNRKRLLKSIGSNKIGGTCPSRIILTNDENARSLTVMFFSDHFFHDHDIRRIPLSKDKRQEIAGKLSAGFPVQRVIDDLRNDCVESEKIQRYHFLSKRDIHNIKRDFGINYSARLQDDDASSVSLWVQKMQRDDETNPVIYFKPLGEESTFVDELYPSSVVHLGKDDLCLLIMTTFQRDLLNYFGNEKICVESTHGISVYGFVLYILFTIDELGNGVPVAFFFTNCDDPNVYTIFFSCMKRAVGCVKTKVFMSDDEPALYEAWTNTMGAASHQLLCAWHVLRNWSQNCHKIRNNEKKNNALKTLKTLMKTSDCALFQDGLTKAIKDMDDDPDTRKFGKYFVDGYAQRCEQWAYCYRSRLGINTNMYNQSIHRSLKYFYSEKKSKRLDEAINAVLRLARDETFERLIKVSTEERLNYIRKINEVHLQASSISADSIIQTNENENVWYIPSQRDVDILYTVVKSDPWCSDCELVCDECDICIHEYTCSCVNNYIQNNICKHIHACAMKLKNEIIKVDFQNVDVDSDIDSFIISKPVLREEDGTNNIDVEINEKLDRLHDLCCKNIFTPELRQTVLHLLDEAISEVENDAKVENETVMAEFLMKEEICSNEISKKPRFCESKKRKLSDTISYTQLDANIIELSFNANSDEILQVYTANEFDHCYSNEQ